MASYCKVLILANSDGQGFTDDAASAGLLTTRLQNQIGDEPCVCKHTLPVADVPVLTKWIKNIKQCPRFLPLQQKVFIMSSPENHDTIMRWAADPKMSDGGFPSENVLCNEVPGSSGCAVADGVAGYLQATGEPDATLVVIEADHLFEPEFGISRVIEHAMVRAQDCITFTAVNPTIPMVPRCAVGMEGPERSPKLTRIDPLGEPLPGDTMLGPVTVLRKDSVADVAAVAEKGLPAGRQLGEFLQARLASTGKPPVYGLQFGECFSVDSLEGYLFTHHFFEWYKQQKDGMAGEKLRVEEGKIFLSEDSKLGGDIMAKTELKQETIETLSRPGAMPWSSRLEIAPLVETFKDIYVRRQAELKLKPERELPPRFANVSQWNYKTAKTEHPCYATSNNTYGAKKPTQPQMVNAFYGANGRFTKTFPNNFKNDSLNCAKTRSKVHTELDEF